MQTQIMLSPQDPWWWKPLISADSGVDLISDALSARNLVVHTVFEKLVSQIATKIEWRKKSQQSFWQRWTYTQRAWGGSACSWPRKHSLQIRKSSMKVRLVSQSNSRQLPECCMGSSPRVAWDYKTRIIPGTLQSFASLVSTVTPPLCESDKLISLLNYSKDTLLWFTVILSHWCLIVWCCPDTGGRHQVSGLVNVRCPRQTCRSNTPQFYFTEGDHRLLQFASDCQCGIVGWACSIWGLRWLTRASWTSSWRRFFPLKPCRKLGLVWQQLPPKARPDLRWRMSQQNFVIRRSALTNHHRNCRPFFAMAFPKLGFDLSPPVRWGLLDFMLATSPLPPPPPLLSSPRHPLNRKRPMPVVPTGPQRSKECQN